jgi:ribosomal RNA methyltransferase Nop2
MGRRAKNKQGDPTPIRDPQDKPSAKKLGKRKAAEVEDAPARPLKKAKEAKPKAKNASVKMGGKDVSGLKKKKTVSFNEEDGSEGWEDVDDEEGGLVAESK